MPGLTLPRRRIILVLSIVKSLFILNTEAFFRPVLEKSGGIGASGKSAIGNSPNGTIEEIKAITMSDSCGSAEIMTAGRNFPVVKSVKER